MADTVFCTIADSIAEEINDSVAADGFDVTFEASVIWADRRKELAREDELKVHVVPTNWSLGIDADGVWKYVCRYQIGVRKKFGAADIDQNTGQILDAEIRTLTTLLADLMEMFAPKQPDNSGRILTDMPSASWATEDDLDRDMAVHAMIDWEILREKKMFLGWFELAFEADG